MIRQAALFIMAFSLTGCCFGECTGSASYTSGNTDNPVSYSEIEKRYSDMALEIVTGNGKVMVNAAVADTPAARRKGLMDTQALPENAGMLFVFENEGWHSFWMKNTTIPLDIIFISSNNEIVDIKENAQPCREDADRPCKNYRTAEKALYVLEVNAGFSRKNSIKKGDYLTKLQG